MELLHITKSDGAVPSLTYWSISVSSSSISRSLCLSSSSSIIGQITSDYDYVIMFKLLLGMIAVVLNLIVSSCDSVNMGKLAENHLLSLNLCICIKMAHKLMVNNIIDADSSATKIIYKYKNTKNFYNQKTSSWTLLIFQTAVLQYCSCPQDGVSNL